MMKCEWCGGPSDGKHNCHMQVCADCFEFVGMFLEKGMRFLIFNHTTPAQRLSMRKEFDEGREH